MSRGKSIRIYMADGTVTGIRHAEIVNWTGQGIACPRNKVSELTAWEEARLPGVYFLFGRGDSSEKTLAYIGEAENVLKRLQNHLANKEFWNEVIFFTNKDENLTKAHVKYLESKLILKAHSAGRYDLENENQPNESLLPRADRDSMEEFLDHLRLLLGALGHKILEPLTTIGVQKTPEQITNSNQKENVEQNILRDNKLSMQFKHITAQAVQTDEGIVVLKGSEALARIKDTLKGYKKLKEDLIQEEILVKKDDDMIFMSDYLFLSPSAASAIIAGQPMNGRTSWKNESGKTLKDIEESVTKNL
jgi:hypothetical protein